MKNLLLTILMLTAACVTPKNTPLLKSFTIRLSPGQDLKAELQKFAKQNHLQAGAIVSCAGSLKTVSLRFANQKDATAYHGFHEIVSLSGTLSEDGMHVHMAVSDSTGKTIGGHLTDGNIIYTTAEIVIFEQPNLQFRRELDPASGYKELVIEHH